ncbi:MAG: DUF1501 domain-containing protein [Betaproteobacteria bacterium]
MKTFNLHQDRRRFLQMMSAAAATPFMGSMMQAAYAAGPYTDYRALVCVFLFGGNDSQNMIIPLNLEAGGEYSKYVTGRGNLAIPSANIIPVSAGVSGRNFGFHPRLTGLANIFNTERKLACVNNVSVLLQPTSKAQYAAGTNLPPQLFSHSDMQSHWQTGRADAPALSGWGGRLGDLIEAANGNSQVSISISAAGQNLFQKGNSAVSYAVSGWNGPKSTIVKRVRAYRDWDKAANRPNPQGAMENQFNILRANVLEDQWGDAASRALITSEFVNSSLYALDANGGPAKDGSGNYIEDFPITPVPPLTFVDSAGLTKTNRLAGQLRSVASMIAARDALGVKRQVFFVSLGGFDNHGDQFKGSADATTPILGGLHADLLLQLDQALSWFYGWTKTAGVANNVTAFTASDFGRTLTSNGLGSDHGWGGHHFALGGAVSGGAFYGGPNAGQEFPTVALGSSNEVGQGRLLPTTSVEEYGATFAKWMGASASDLGTVFPNLSRFPRANGMPFLT